MGGSQGGKCAHKPNGECRCKPAVKGSRCEQCIDGYYGLGTDDKIGCKSCNYECSADGTFGEVCDKINGNCICKKGWWGDACDRKCQQCNGRTCDQDTGYCNEVVFQDKKTAWKNCGKSKSKREEEFARQRRAVGTDADIEKHPWVIVIKDENDKIHCGGVIASSNRLISAGHCFVDEVTKKEMTRSQKQNFK